ncbi:MAG: arginase family protein [Candidatus Lokiarchaeota archaeon]|nr:arginase family protein [Candidatus Lokiarchaeota archaeon]
MKKNIKIFGASLDATDLPLSIKTKLLYLDRRLRKEIPEPSFFDPYDGILLYSKILSNDKYLKIGKIPIKTWLTPKPCIEDISRINQLAFQKFSNDGLVEKYSNEVEQLVKSKVLPDIPLMIGVDHSLTGGVLRALSQKYGPENILIVIFDAHFDGIPAKVAVNIARYFQDHPDQSNLLVPELAYEMTSDIKNTYTCASFLYYLIEDAIILPENVIIFGCQDYPRGEFRAIEDPRIIEYVNFFDRMESNGVSFVPKIRPEEMISALSSKLERVKKPYLYISCDVDVGALKDIIASRYKNAIGIEKSTLIQAFQVLKNTIDSSDCELIGLDFMEIDTFLLNRYFPKTQRKDSTIEIIDALLKILF